MSNMPPSMELSSSSSSLTASFFFNNLGSSSNWSSCSKCGRISQISLHGLSLFKGDVRDGGQCHAVLHTINDRMRNRGYGRITDLQTKGSNVSDTSQNVGFEVLIGNVQDGNQKWIQNHRPCLPPDRR